MHAFRIVATCVLLSSVAFTVPMPQTADPAAAPSVAGDAAAPTTDFDPSSFSAGPDFSSAAEGAGPAGDSSVPAITRDDDPITSPSSSNSTLPNVGADDFGSINGLLSGLSSLQANAGTSNGDDKSTDAGLANLNGTGALPATGPSEEGASDPSNTAVMESSAANPVGLLAAALTASAASMSPNSSANSASSATAAAVTPTPTLVPEANSTADFTNATDTAAAASGSLTFDLSGFLSGAEFDPAATAPAGAIAAAAPTASS
ncbi:hypothetical protein JCM3774_006476 [Rhodotorula dairenensis]